MNSDTDALADLPHGTRVRIGGELLIMDRDKPRPAFDCYDTDGQFIGYLYPHNVTEQYETGDYQIEPNE